MPDIIDFKKIRLENLLIKFAKSNEVPIEFIDGRMNPDELFNLYKESLSEYHLKLLNKLKRILASRLRKSQENIYESFMEEYLYFYKHQCTKEDKWVYPIVSSKYRDNLNPIRALYYELLNIMNSYNPESEVHTFVLDLFTDAEWRNTIINCVQKDINAIDHITSTYHYPLEKIGEKPFEFFYLIELKKDLVNARSVFRSMEHWSPDE
jgi:ATP-dependent Lon protease